MVEGDLDAYNTYINSFPLNPSPEVFGLHENSNITTNSNETLALVDDLTSVAPRTGGSGTGRSKEDIIEKRASDIQEKTPKPFDYEAVFEKFPTSYNESINTVLTQECIKYNRLIVRMMKSLSDLGKAVKGLVVMSEELDAVGDALTINQVPGHWSEVGFLSMKPLSSWIKDLIDRVAFLQGWIENGTPSIFWVSGFFFPQAFLTGTLQNYARKHIISIERLG